MISDYPISYLPVSGSAPYGEYVVAAVTSTPSISFKIGFDYVVAASTTTPGIVMTAEFVTPFVISATTSAPSIDATIISGRLMTVAATTQKPSISVGISSGRAFSVGAATAAPALLMSVLRSSSYALSASTAPPSVLMLFAANATPSIASGDTTAWCVNMVTGGHTRYTNFPDSTDADAIAARVVTGVMDFGSLSVKRITDLYAHCRLIDGDLMIDTVTDEHVTVDGYYMETRNTAGLVRRRVKLAKGVKGMNWQFIVTNVNGCDFALQTLEAIPIQLARHK